jgi:hypothetical protein
MDTLGTPQSQADQNNTDRLSKLNPTSSSQTDPLHEGNSGTPHSWDVPRTNPYTGTSYTPGSIAAQPMTGTQFEQNKSITLPATTSPEMKPLSPIANPQQSSLTFSSPLFQTGASPSPTPAPASTQPTSVPSTLSITPTFQSGKLGSPALGGSSAAPAVTSLPPTTTLTPNAGIANGLVEPHPTATMKITPLNGISNGMPLPNSAVNPTAPAGQAASTGTDWNAKFLKDTGTAYNGTKSAMDRLNMDRLQHGLPTFNHKEYRSYLASK